MCINIITPQMNWKGSNKIIQGLCIIQKPQYFRALSKGTTVLSKSYTSTCIIHRHFIFIPRDDIKLSASRIDNVAPFKFSVCNLISSRSHEEKSTPLKLVCEASIPLNLTSVYTFFFKTHSSKNVSGKSQFSAVKLFNLQKEKEAYLLLHSLNSVSTNVPRKNVTF